MGIPDMGIPDMGIPDLGVLDRRTPDLGKLGRTFLVG